GPERLLSIGPFPLGGGDGALVERPGVMRERRGEVHRAQENVDVPEEVRPGGTGRMPPAFLVDDRGQRSEVLRTRLRVGKEQPGLEAECLRALSRVNSCGPAFGDPDAGPPERLRA